MKNQFYKYVLTVFVICFNNTINAQTKINKEGALQLGLRSSQSFFNSTGNIGSGIGGQFRIMLANKLNTDWFADYFTENLDDLGKRTDAHIGWSVVFYFKESENKWQPYIVAGHCFDYTRITTFSVPQLEIAKQTKERWSSAVQAGAGAQWNVTEIFNITLQTQYMMHLGKDFHIHKESTKNATYLIIDENNKQSLEGHLLFTVAFNIKIAELW
jgi:opacity protein-like surface antigen